MVYMGYVWDILCDQSPKLGNRCIRVRQLVSNLVIDSYYFVSDMKFLHETLLQERSRF
jgi:hypothetical protein